MWVSDDSSGLKNTREDTTMYWFRLSEPYVQRWLFFVFESTQIGGYNGRDRDLVGDCSVLSYGSLVVRFLPQQERGTLRPLTGLPMGGTLRHSFLFRGELGMLCRSSLCASVRPLPYRCRPSPLYFEGGRVQGGSGVKFVVFVHQSTGGHCRGMYRP